MALRVTLPAETTSFVGREAELSALEQALSGGARLVTILGPPGVGKSRLALRFAARRLAARAHRDGVIACELADATSAEELCAALRRALDITVPPEPRGGDIVAELGVRLGDVLVLLDNMEHLVTVGPETIGRWLTIAPEARFLATSRERLRLAGEVVRELGPLSLPGGGVDLKSSEAVQLFVERARAVRPQFTVSPDNEAAVAQVVEELDGLPLAIELGATRMAMLSPARLLERLPRRFDVLSSPIRNPAARQRTLREAIDASFVLLSPVERSALLQVSVFRGGFTLEAAEAVVDLREHDGPPLLDVLQSLLDKSLIYSHSPVHLPDEVRFDLYLSIRDHAWARLEASGRAPEVLDRHASYFSGAAALAGEDLQGQAEIDRLRRTALEIHNHTAVHRYMLGASSDRPEAEAAAAALRSALALEGALSRWGPIQSLCAMLDDALRAGAGALPVELRLRGLLARADACRLLGRLQESLTDSEAALALADAASHLAARPLAAAGIGLALREMGRLPEAQRWLEGALEGLRAAGARRVEVRARTALERIYTVMGHGQQARVHREELSRLLSAEQDRELVVSSLLGAATLAIAEGRLTEAELHLEQVQAELRDLSSPGLEGLAMNTLALLRGEQGRLAEARACAEASISLARRIGNGRMEGFSQAQRAVLLAQAGDLSEARAAAQRAVALLRDTGDTRASAFFSAVLAAIEARLGHPARAAQLFEEVDASLKEVGDPMLRAAVEVYRVTLSPERAAEVIEATREAAARSHHVRAGVRLLEQQLAERAADTGAAAQSGALVISPDGRWCRLPDGREVSFRRGRALRLMLLRLVDERLAAPGRALPLSALFESGWPGERASAEALHNRVYVGVSRLRKMGFGSLILSRDDGFLLDPAVPTFRSDRPD